MKMHLSYIKVFTFLNQKVKLKNLILEHNKDKTRRLLQNKIAEIQLHLMVHGQEDLKNAIKCFKSSFWKI